jgi:hypothetical protein
MKPGDKKKLQDAWRKSIDRHADADGIVKDLFVDGKPATRRQLVEASLASEQTYQAIDEYLTANPKVTLDDFIKSNFEKPDPKKTGPKL